MRFESDLRTRLIKFAQLQKNPRPIKHFQSSEPNQPALVVYDLVREEGGLNVPTGLGVDLHIETPTINAAIAQSGFAVEHLVDLFTFVTLAEPAMMRFVLAYDATPGLLQRELIAQNSLGKTTVSRPLREHLLKPLLDSANAARAAAKSSAELADRILRIDRAMKWLRKGIGETAILDEFTAYWVGLEVIDPLIKPVVRIFRTCPECGLTVDRCNHCNKELAKSERITNPLEGVRFVVEEKQGVSKKDFNKIRGMRGALLHGGTGLDDAALKLITGCMPYFRHALIQSICMALGLSDVVTAALMAPEPRRLHSPLNQRLREFITMESVPSLDQVDKQPRIEVTFSRKLELRRGADDINETSSVQIKEINCQLAENSTRVAEIVADPFSGVRISVPAS